MRIVAIIYFLLLASSSFAQADKKLLKEGNKFYSEKNFEKASEIYKDAASKNVESLTAYSNLGNSLFKEKKYDDALKAYDQALALEKDNSKISNLHHNKGVVYQTNNKLPECIVEYKKALRVDPNDDDARQNLQKALKKQEEQKKKDNKDKKDDKMDDKKDNPEKEPKPQKSNLTKQEAEDKLKALMQQEKNLQNKLHKGNPQSNSSPEKDW